MKIAAFLIGAGASIILGSALGCGLTPQPELPDLDGPPNGGPPAPVRQPRPPSAGNYTGRWAGRVTALGPDWFEVQAPAKDPRRFLADRTTPGGDEKGVGQRRTHRVAQLEIGDLVGVETGKDGPDEICLFIQIVRRPGGQIPPMWGDTFAGTPHAFHLQNQAYQDWEEKGIPIPAKYHGVDGRCPWTNPPYPPVAPMPREARPTPRP